MHMKDMKTRLLNKQYNIGHNIIIVRKRMFKDYLTSTGKIEGKASE